MTAPVARLLRAVRRRLRLVALLDGLAWLMLGVVGYFWLSLAFDYTVEPNRDGRQLLLAAGGGWLLLLVFRFLVAPWNQSLPDLSMALLVERRYPALGDALLTSVELSKRDHPFSRPLVAAATQRTLDLMEGITVNRVVGVATPAKRWAWGLGALLTVGVFVAASPAVAGTWYRRSLLLLDVEYPKETHLNVVGFDQGRRKEARGRDVEVVVEADNAGVIPDKVSLTYEMAKSGGGRVYMTKVGADQFKYTFRNVIEPVRFWVQGNDDATDWHELTLVEPPTLTRVALDVAYPEYTLLSRRTLEAGGTPLSLPVGSQVLLSLHVNKPLQWINLTEDERDLPVVPHAAEQFRSEFSLEKNRSLKINFRDLDGIEPLEPFPLDLTAVVDQPPSVQAVLNGVSQAVTPIARVPVEAKIADDYGIKRIAFTSTILDGPTQNWVIESPAVPESKFEREVAFEVGELKLKSGARFNLQLKAEDDDRLNGPHEGASEVFTFEVVTEEELLARLADRELQLRYTLEQIVRELVDAKESVAGIEKLTGDESEKAAGLRRLHAQTVVQQIRKSANETAALADAARTILAELSNNRVSNTAVFDRVETGVVLPLDGLVIGGFPRAEQNVVNLKQAVENSDSELEDPLAAAQRSLDELIRECRSILNAMRKLESFNEAIALLRKIMKSEEQLLEKTRQERKKALLELLE